MELIKGKSFGKYAKYSAKNNFTAESARENALAMAR